MSRRVLITGGCGFIGSHFVEHFIKNTDDVIISLDRLDTSGNPNRLAQVVPAELFGKRFKSLYWDLRSPVSQQMIEWIGPVDWVLHLAAATHVDRSIEDPMSFVMDNVVGTTNVLEFARKVGAKMLYFSTDEVFGPAPNTVKYAELDRYNSGNPYAASKAGAEEMCVAYGNTYKLPVMITHCMNVFGERQHPEKYIPMVIKKVLNGETITIHSDRTKTTPGSRFYIHARNVAAAVLFLMTEGTTGQKYNIVGEKEVNNLEIAQVIAKVLDKPLLYELTDFHSSRPGHDLRYALDGTKMDAMGWKIPLTFEQSITKTVLWTVEHKEWLCG